MKFEVSVPAPIAERAKLPMKSTKYPFLGLLPFPNAVMLALSSGSNSTLPHVASMPSGTPARRGNFVIRADSPSLREYR